MVSKTSWLDRHLEEIDAAIEDKPRGESWFHAMRRTGIVNYALYLANVDETRKITVGTGMEIMCLLVGECIFWIVRCVTDIVVMKERKDAEEEAD